MVHVVSRFSPPGDHYPAVPTAKGFLSCRSLDVFCSQIKVCLSMNEVSWALFIVKQKFYTGNLKWPGETLSHTSQVSDHGWERNRGALQKLKTLFPPQQPWPGENTEQIGFNWTKSAKIPQSIRFGSLGSPSPMHDADGILNSHATRPHPSSTGGPCCPALGQSQGCLSPCRNPHNMGFAVLGEQVPWQRSPQEPRAAACSRTAISP